MKPAKQYREILDVALDSDECILWKHRIKGNGYGVVSIDKRRPRVHRLSYSLHYGPIPPGLFVCHHCDQRACYNPRHLFLGTHDDNMRDMVEKGRQAHQPQKLTETAVRSMRNDYKPGIRGCGYGALAAKYGVNENSVKSIVQLKTWKHVNF